jgi:hypothetical protein
MSAQKKNNIPAEKLDFYDKLIKTNPKIERKGAANPYTSVNGHMFTYLNPYGSLAVVRQNSGRLQNQQHTTIFPIIDLV